MRSDLCNTCYKCVKSVWGWCRFRLARLRQLRHPPLNWEQFPHTELKRRLGHNEGARSGWSWHSEPLVDNMQTTVWVVCACMCARAYRLASLCASVRCFWQLTATWNVDKTRSKPLLLKQKPSILSVGNSTRNLTCGETYTVGKSNEQRAPPPPSLAGIQPPE